MTKIMCTALVLIALIAVPAAAQESSEADFQEFCEVMEGHWVGEITWNTDWPGVAEKGDTTLIHGEMKVVENGKAILGRWFGGSASGTWLTVYDVNAKQIKETMVDSGGNTSLTVYFKQKGGGWASRGSGSQGDGDKVTSKATLEISDAGMTHTWTGTTTVNGEKSDETSDVFRRVRSQ